MTFAKTFGQRHVLRFLSSHIDLSGCRITAASPAGLRVTDGVHKLCLKSTNCGIAGKPLASLSLTPAALRC